MIILKCYHEQLIQNGVTGYSWEQLVGDYRLCVPIGVAIAVEYCRGGLNSQWVHVWLQMRERTLIASDDLNCSALWQEG
jgi:hypothetical protein